MRIIFEDSVVNKNFASNNLNSFNPSIFFKQYPKNSFDSHSKYPQGGLLYLKL